MKHFRLPDPGEGLVEAEIITWQVAVGDEVTVNDIVVEIETSKSLVELPIPWTGRVAQLHVPEGTMVEVGTVIISIDDGTGDGEVVSGGLAEALPDQATSTADSEAGEAPEPMLVGSGPKAEASARRPRRGRPGQGDGQAGQQVAGTFNQSEPSRRSDDVQAPQAVRAEATGAPLPTPGEAPRGSAVVLHSGAKEPLAKPPVRMLAKLLGVDLAAVTGTGPDGVITRADVEAASVWADFERRGGSAQRPTEARNSFVGDPAEPLGASARANWTTGERRVPIKGVRKVTAEAMVASIRNHAHVTEWITVDVTATMELVEKLKRRREFADLRVSPLLVYAKAVCLAMANNPDLNTSWDDQNQEIVYHADVNLGVAAATPRGLMVPNVKGAQRMSLVELGRALTALVQVSREGRLQPVDYTGGTFTITNVGVFGVQSGTPIINGQESAILCMGAIDRKPWVVEDEAGERIEPRWVTTISLSFDHKVIDGEQGSRFLHEVATILADPDLALLY